MRDGIANRIDPGDPHRSRTTSRIRRKARFALLPRTLGEALEALDRTRSCAVRCPASSTTPSSSIKRDEWQRACGAVTEWDRETYLTYIP